MAHRRTFIALICLLVAACSPTVGVVSDRPAGKSEPAATFEDMALVDLVAQDFANSADCADGLGKSGMIVNSYAGSAQGMVSDDWLRAHMSPEVWAKAKALTPRLRERNPNAQRMDWSFPDAKDIKVEDLSKMRGYLAYIDASKDVRCLTTFLLPAVSADGKLALVALEIFSDHGAVAFYLLRRDQNTWLIDSHAFFAFI